jgi:hypothetical protein
MLRRSTQKGFQLHDAKHGQSTCGPIQIPIHTRIKTRLVLDKLGVRVDWLLLAFFPVNAMTLSRDVTCWTKLRAIPIWLSDKTDCYTRLGEKYKARREYVKQMSSYKNMHSNPKSIDDLRTPNASSASASLNIVKALKRGYVTHRQWQHSSYTS